MDDAFVRKILDYLYDYMDQYRKLLASQFSDVNWDTRPLSDEMHRRWFEGKIRENPLWLFALPFVRGGASEISRYERTIGAM